MPRIHIFENCGCSSGDGFIKAPSSGMWQCTLPSNAEQSPRVIAKKGRNGGHEILVKHTGLTGASGICPFVVESYDCGLTNPRGPQPCAQLVPRFVSPQRLQLISTSSRFLCSFLLTTNVRSADEVDVISFQCVCPGARTPSGTGIAFAAAAEATWVDVVSLLRGEQIKGRTSFNAARVWRLQWGVVEAAEVEGVSDLRAGSTLAWRVVEELPLKGLVEDAVSRGGGTLQVAIAGARRKEECRKTAAASPRAESGSNKREPAAKAADADIPRFTPAAHVISADAEPPTLQPKLKRQREGESDPSSPRNLTVEFALAQEMDAKGAVGELRGGKGTDGTMSAGLVAPQRSGKRKPTYAEVLMRSEQPTDTARVAGPKVLVLREWRQRLGELRVEVGYVNNEDGILSLAKGWLRETGKESVGKSVKMVTTLVSASLRELLCGAHLNVAVQCRLSRCKKSDELASLRKCVDIAVVLGKEVDKLPQDTSVGLQFSKYILKLRLLRHRCFATVLMDKTVSRPLFVEALRLCRRLLRLLKEENIASTNSNVCDKDSDACSRQISLGVYTAALAAMELSLFTPENNKVQNGITLIAGELFLWLCNSKCEERDVPASLLACLESMVDEGSGLHQGGARVLSELLSSLESPTAILACSERCSNTVELCCGVVRDVANSAAFDQQFARTGALLRRVRTLGGKTNEKNG
ncbi:uncharacterized protein TEOVI_000358500 [Trypanosoma equiperdum]|uniref:Uncharacterized protein n=1 Tax=Trypanosoma equiperdum TaxID=5694 RepID=A0A1G4IHS7_TRYEQ|nr:hypothetical protein, conserved [Trypanosoma equiperdum]